jgi:hypothetical protein
MVNNPQMIDLQRLTVDNFTAKTGINVNFTVLPENDVRDKISQEFSSQAGQYDVRGRRRPARTSPSVSQPGPPRPSDARRANSQGQPVDPRSNPGRQGRSELGDNHCQNPLHAYSPRAPGASPSTPHITPGLTLGSLTRLIAGVDYEQVVTAGIPPYSDPSQHTKIAMLQPFIIEQIRRREEEARRRKKDAAQQPRLEIPIDAHRPAPEPNDYDEPRDRGVVIVDL